MSEDTSAPFDDLYRENQAKIFRLALSLTGNRQDAEEITQETFLRAFRSYSSFRRECSFSTWIYRIALNLSRDRLKYRTRLPSQVLQDDPGYSPREIAHSEDDPETRAMEHQIRVRCLHSLTECLKADERRVFCLAITLGMPQAYIAEILETSVGSVKTTLYRARKRWFGYMENRCSLIRRSNPCRCSQWIQYALSQGWTSGAAPLNSRPPSSVRTEEEILSLRALRNLYQDLYPGTPDESFMQRVREGIKNKEWAFLSNP